jgi:hypothetical protein
MTSATNADRYMEVGFQSGAGNVYWNDIVHFECDYKSQNNLTFTQTGDYSFDATKTAFANWNKVTVYRNGVLVLGTEPTLTLRNPENPANTSQGLHYKYFVGSWNPLPNFDSLIPTTTGTTTNIDLTKAEQGDNYGLRFDGYIDVPTDGNYTFYTNSDDGSNLYIGTTLVVNNDGNHGPRERSGVIGLKAGKHAIRVEFFENGGGEVLTASYAGPGITKQVIPTSVLYRTPCIDPALIYCDDFEDGNDNGWTEQTNSNFLVVANAGYPSGGDTYKGGLGAYYATAGSTSWTDQTVEAKVKVIAFGGADNTYKAGVVGRFSSGSAYYQLVLNRDGNLEILRAGSALTGTSGTCGALTSGLGANPINTWATLKMKISGTSTVRIQTWYNGTAKHDCNTTGSPVGSGSAGVVTVGANTDSYFDDFAVSTP